MMDMVIEKSDDYPWSYHWMVLSNGCKLCSYNLFEESILCFNTKSSKLFSKLRRLQSMFIYST